MKIKKIALSTSGLALTALLAACGGDGSSSLPTLTSNTATAASYTVSATVSGLSGTLGLTDGTDTANDTTDGTYTFKTALGAGTKYDVKVTSQPSGETCTVSNASGTISSSDVSNVTISCALNPASVTTSTSTGFSVLASGSTRVALLPVSTGVATLNLSSTLSASKAKAAIKTAMVSAPSTSSTITLPFKPDECSVDASALKAVCISLSQPELAVLDLSKFVTSLNPADVTIQTVTLSDISSLPSTSFSGDYCQSCGVVIVPDASNPSSAQIIISAEDGYHVYAYPAAGVTTMSATHVYAIPISENLAVDVANDRLIAPDYGAPSSSGQHVMNIVNLSTGSIYAWTQPVCTTLTDPNQQTLCTAFSEELIDSSAVDPTTGMLILQSESGQEVAELDMSQATFTPGSGSSNGTITAPVQYASMDNTAAVDMSGSLVSGVGDDLFSGSEFSAGAIISAAQLPTTGGKGGAFPTTPAMAPVYTDLSTLLSNMGASAPCTGGFSGANDPHNEATTLSIDNHQYGLYASLGNRCVALIDLGALVAEPRDTTNTNQVASSVNLTGTGVVDFFAIP